MLCKWNLVGISELYFEEVGLKKRNKRSTFTLFSGRQRSDLRYALGTLRRQCHKVDDIVVTGWTGEISTFSNWFTRGSRYVVLRDVPLARYVILLVAHAPGMPGTFSPLPRVSDPDIHHGTCVTHVPWCMPGSLTSGPRPGIPGTCVTCKFTYLVRGPWLGASFYWYPSGLLHWCWTYTERCGYNAVNLLSKAENRHTKWGIGCEYNLWFIFWLGHCSTVYNLMLYWTAL